MKNTIIAVIALVVIGLGVYMLKGKPEESLPGEPNVNASIVGCYVATLSQDVYSLKINKEVGEAVEGTLVFKNFEKDSSHGTFKGTYKDGILLGDYSFNSEGMDSVMQVIFKKSKNTFIRGYGSLDSTGTKFSDLSKVTYDPNQTFQASTTCAISL